MSQRELHYQNTINRYLNGKATLEEVYAADPHDGALQLMAKRITEQRFGRQQPAKTKGINRSKLRQSRIIREAGRSRNSP